MEQSKPNFRSVDIELGEPFIGWKAKMRAEGISARVFIDLQSGSAQKSMEALERLVISHNFLDENGKATESILDAPMDSLTEAITKWSDAVAALPPR